jgi:DNA-binding CsgD family transcriptional regulator
LDKLPEVAELTESQPQPVLAVPTGTKSPPALGSQRSQPTPDPLLMWVYLQKRLDSAAFIENYCPHPGVIASQISSLDEAFFVRRTRNLLVTDHELPCPATAFRRAHPDALSFAVELSSGRARHSSWKCCPRMPRSMSVEDFWAAITELAEPHRYAGQPFADRIAEEALTQPETRGISLREFQALRLLAEGYSISECAQRMNLAGSTVENHKYRIMKKLNIHRAHELVLLGARLGWIHQSTFSPTERPAAETLAENSPKSA